MKIYTEESVTEVLPHRSGYMQPVPIPKSSVHPLLKAMLFGVVSIVVLALSFPLLAKLLYYRRLDHIIDPTPEKLAIIARWKDDIFAVQGIPPQSQSVYDQVGGIQAFVVFPMPSQFRGELRRERNKDRFQGDVERILSAMPDPYYGPVIKPDYVVFTNNNTANRSVGNEIACDSQQHQCCLVYFYGGDGPYLTF